MTKVLTTAMDCVFLGFFDFNEKLSSLEDGVSHMSVDTNLL